VNEQKLISQTYNGTTVITGTLNRIVAKEDFPLALLDVS
jgi:hypothetical protein